MKKLPADVNRWSPEWLYRLREREAIMQYEGRMDEREARQKAIADTRRQAERE